MIQVLLLGFIAQNSANESLEELLAKAEAARAKGQYAVAAELCTAAIKKRPDDGGLYYMRGRLYFRSGQVKKAVVDFDRCVKLAPRRASRQWERGIACYYARQFKKGAAQFELYQTYHANDVENSVWRFLCMVPSDGVKKARKVMLPIENDRRLAMMKVYDMYRGKASPEDVLATVKSAGEGAANRETRDAGYFYAYLYIGLYEEVLGRASSARKYIEKAADKKYAANGRVNTYMWDVARIHLDQMKAKEAAAKKSSKPAKSPNKNESSDNRFN